MGAKVDQIKAVVTLKSDMNAQAFALDPSQVGEKTDGRLPVDQKAQS